MSALPLSSYLVFISVLGSEVYCQAQALQYYLH